MKIGDFARLGQVSVRMLRNYDELGLLAPAAVDPWTNYRSYTADQLARLNRIVALRGLGFGLDAIGRLLDDDLTVEQLEGMLKLRRAELAEQLCSTSEQLAAVEARLRLIEGEGMSQREFVIKELAALRLAERSFTAPLVEETGRRLGVLYGEVFGAIKRAGGEPGLPVGYYLAEGELMECHVGYVYAGQPAGGFEISELPQVAEAVACVHLGAVEGIGEAWQAIGRWLEENGAEPSAPGRELYLETPLDDPDAWVTELQQPFVRRP